MVGKHEKSDKLQKLSLKTLLKRRMRDYINETFKIINGISDYDKKKKD